MTDFSPSDAAIEGFRVTREKPGSVLIWALIFSATILLAGIFISAGFAPMLGGATRGLDPENPQAAMAVAAQLSPLALAIIAVWIGVSGVINAALYRRILHPEEQGFAYLQLGGDELRQVGALFLTLLVSNLPTWILGALGVSGPAGALGATFALAFQIWLGLRLSLLPALTFATKRIDVVSAWQLTRGQLWRLLGMFLLAIIFAAIVFLLVMIIATILAVLISGGNIGVLSQLHDMRDVSTNTALALLSYTVIVFLLAPVLMMVIIQAPTAVAYRALSKDK